MINQFRKISRQGFVILYAVIVVMAIATIGLVLMNIISKQLILSSISDRSKIAYYAALSGYDCADAVRDGRFRSSSDQLCCGSGSGSTNCANAAIVNNNVFSYTLPLGVDTCAVVTTSYDSTLGLVSISSAGYDVSCNSINSLNTRAVQSNVHD